MTNTSPTTPMVAGQVHPSSQRFFDLLEQMRSVHVSKSHVYGSEHDPLANIRNGARFVGIEPWRAALVRLSDKVTRIGTYCSKGTLCNEGVEDSFLDLANYALLALLMWQEEHAGPPNDPAAERPAAQHDTGTPEP
jgi:hypothetical protein